MVPESLVRIFVRQSRCSTLLAIASGHQHLVLGSSHPFILWLLCDISLVCVSTRNRRCLASGKNRPKRSQRYFFTCRRRRLYGSSFGIRLIPRTPVESDKQRPGQQGLAVGSAGGSPFPLSSTTRWVPYRFTIPHALRFTTQVSGHDFSA